jgi:hypothetical protein
MYTYILYTHSLSHTHTRIYIYEAAHLPSPHDDDHPFIVLTETKFSIRYIPVWAWYSPLRTRVESTCDNALTMTPPVHW